MSSLIGTTYADQSQEYRDQWSKDEFKGQRALEKRSQAMQTAKDAVGGAALTEEQRLNIRGMSPVSHMQNSADGGKQFYQTGDDGRRNLVEFDQNTANPFNVENLEDFDLTAYGHDSATNKGTLNKHDVTGLLQAGNFDINQINEYASGLDNVGVGAQKFLKKKMEEYQANQTTTPTNTNTNTNTTNTNTTTNTTNTTTNTPTTTVDTSGGGSIVNNPGSNAGQQAQELADNYVSNIAYGEQDLGRDFGDNQNTIQDGNTIYGNVNQGNQDFSVNIAGQGAGGGLSNMGIVAAYDGLNEQQYQVSQQLFNPYARAQGNIDATKNSTNVAEGNRAANELYSGLASNYRSEATNYMTNMFGDYWNSENYVPPTWNPPAPPSSLDERYEDDDD